MAVRHPFFYRKSGLPSPKRSYGFAQAGLRPDGLRVYRTPHSMRGFTLIESVMVMVLIAILSFIVIARYNPTDVSNISAETAAIQVESYLRYVQATAMSKYEQTGASFLSDADGWYFVIGGQKHYIPDTVSFSSSGDITFNSLGEPVSPIGTVTVGGITVTVEPVTGKVKRV